MSHNISSTRRGRVTRFFALLVISALFATILASCGIVQRPDGRWELTDDGDKPTGICLAPGTGQSQSYQAAICGPAGPAPSASAAPSTRPSASPSAAASAAPSASASPSGSAAPIGANTLLSTRTDFARVIIQPDGRIWQDQNQPSTNEQNSFNVEFTLPGTLPGGNARIWNGIRCVLSKDGAVIARNSNGLAVDLVPGGKYMASCEQGVNNGFSLDLVQKVGGPTATTYPKVISTSDDWTRVVLTQNGRMYQDKIYEGAPAYTVTFTIPADAPGGPTRFFQGVNAKLLKDGKVIAGPGSNIQFTIELGATYTVEGGAKNGGFALEIPR